MPILCIPYKGLSDAKVRELANKIITEMTNRGMKVAGKVGNHNYFVSSNHLLK